jgi:hypothetical protein
MEMLVMANQELSSYRERDILVNLFRRFVTQNAYVIGVQLYEYSLQHHNGRSSFRLSLLDGYARDNIDVNATQKLHYSFDIGLFREFRDAYEQAFKAEQSILGDEGGQEIETDQIESIEVDSIPIMSFIQKNNHRVSIKPIQTYTQEDAMVYAFVNAAIRLLEGVAGSDIEYFLDPEQKERLESFKRLGYLQAILCECPITFSHIRKNEKADRQYISSPVRINDRQYLYMILLDPEILNDSKRKELMDSLTDSFDSFESNLVNCFDLIYNRIRNGKGDDHNV